MSDFLPAVMIMEGRRTLNNQKPIIEIQSIMSRAQKRALRKLSHRVQCREPWLSRPQFAFGPRRAPCSSWGPVSAPPTWASACVRRGGDGVWVVNGNSFPEQEGSEKENGLKESSSLQCRLVIRLEHQLRLSVGLPPLELLSPVRLGERLLVARHCSMSTLDRGKHMKSKLHFFKANQ